MKKRLLLLVLSILGGAQMQAGSWFESFRNYSPYQWGSFKRYAPENVASRLAAMRYLYGNDVAQDQEQLIDDYYRYLYNKSNRQRARNTNFDKAIWANAQSPVASEEWAPIDILGSYADYMAKLRNQGTKKLLNISRARDALYPFLIQKRTEAEMLKPSSYYQYQHPDQYILNN